MNLLPRCGLTGLRSSLFFVTIAAAVPASAQVQATGLSPYRHTYHPEHGYMPLPGAYGYGLGGYYGGGYGGGTVASGVGDAAAGFGQAAADLGQMHLSNAQAAGAYEDAVTQYLKNSNLDMKTIQENAAIQRQNDEQAQERAKQHAQKQVALHQRTLEQMSAAHRLTAEQFDMDRGVLHWPFVLRGPQYMELRNKLDRLYDARTPEDSGTNSSGYGAIVEACQAMQEIVKKEVQAGQMPVTDFVTADHFISSIEYEAQFPVKAPRSGSVQTGSDGAAPSNVPRSAPSGEQRARQGAGAQN